MLKAQNLLRVCLQSTKDSGVAEACKRKLYSVRQTAQQGANSQTLQTLANQDASVLMSECTCAVYENRALNVLICVAVTCSRPIAIQKYFLPPRGGLRQTFKKVMLIKK